MGAFETVQDCIVRQVQNESHRDLLRILTETYKALGVGHSRIYVSKKKVNYTFVVGLVFSISEFCSVEQQTSRISIVYLYSINFKRSHVQYRHNLE